MAKEKGYAFDIPTTSTFRAYVYAESFEEAKAIIAEGEYEDGNTENEDFDFSKAKFVEEWD